MKDESELEWSEEWVMVQVKRSGFNIEFESREHRFTDELDVEIERKR